jgi:carbon monoxide dehydrogenase subunit G
MTRLHEEIETPLPLDVAFPFVADFANSSRWDPGVRSSEAVDPGPPAVGSRYRLIVRMGGRFAPMEYRVSALEPMRRVVLTGSGSGVSAVDEIRFERSGTGTHIDYTADIRLGGLLRLVQPFLGGSFRKIAKDALAGMERTLNEMSARDTAAPQQAVVPAAAPRPPGA